MDDAYLIRDAILARRASRAERAAAVAALGDLIRDLAEARAALRAVVGVANTLGVDEWLTPEELDGLNGAREMVRGGQPT